MYNKSTLFTVTFIRSRGRRVCARVMSHNVGSLAFYLKMGFKVVGHHNKVVKWGDEYLDTEEIERILK